MDYTWVSWAELRSAAGLPWAISPWAAEQIPLLDASGCRRRTDQSVAQLEDSLGVREVVTPQPRRRVAHQRFDHRRAAQRMREARAGPSAR